MMKIGTCTHGSPPLYARRIAASTNSRGTHDPDRCCRGAFQHRTRPPHRPQPTCSLQHSAHQISERESQHRIPTWVPFSRRTLMGVGASMLVTAQEVHAAAIPPPPQVGACADCIGESETTLNVCNEEAASCVSTQNDDEAHFLAPWSYDGGREAAVSRLIEVATGGVYSPGMSDDPLGISRSSAAGFILGGVANVLQGKPPPERPERAQGKEPVRFDGVPADRHTTGEGAEYVRLVFGTAGGAATEVEDPSAVIDAEFLFLQDDNIVVLRAASRASPPRAQGNLSLSFSKGIVFDANASGRLLERLRKALRWEVTPVITDFDPRFNGKKPLWFERLYKPFLQGKYGSDQQGDDQSDRPLVDGQRM